MGYLLDFDSLDANKKKDMKVYFVNFILESQFNISIFQLKRHP